MDAGLRAYMLSIYNYMVLGLAITGFAALGTYMLAVTDNPADAVVRLRDGVFLTSFGQWVFVSPLKYVIMLAPLGVVFLLSARVNSMSAQSAQITFWVFAGLMGLSLASIFLVFTHTSIVRVFFITAASFGALSLYGYTTQKDLSGMASFLIMGLIGIVIASLVNIFLASSAMQFAISVIGVLVFAGLTAYDTQRLKTEYLYGGMDGFAQQKSAILGALSLYLNFINMFTMLLQLFGNRE
ncbi:membrane protein [Blastochloris viridis]|uniref:Membrane protein n=1 Tax=Blastochloris viridis TaxID=1079 RepID=A0A182D207_BLAVI|nr:membrane protein [Blastochloris viridis]